MSAYENTVLDSTVNYISDLADYVSKPWQRPEGADYFGGKEGLDIADPLDIAWSTGSSAYRIFDKLGRWPFAKSMMYGGDLLSGLVGDNITSQEEAEAIARSNGDVGCYCDRDGASDTFVEVESVKVIE